MEKMTVLEIPEEEVPKLAVTLAQVVARLREIDEEHEARQARIAASSAETEQALAAIKRSLANVEKFLSASVAPLHL